MPSFVDDADGPGAGVVAIAEVAAIEGVFADVKRRGDVERRRELGRSGEREEQYRERPGDDDAEDVVPA